ncbi:hypothetical protein M885DRAFT_39669 [Pelagophyceae sp. CCMP2097]|nr:hypothetical protein M885DRAFT_39669 [Pelagophyceae sp. CCMP2097]
MRPSDGVPSDGAPRDAESDAATETAVDAALARQRAALRNALSRAEASEAAAAALSDAVARLEKRWTLSQKPFDEVAAAIEASVMSKVAQLTNRNEALERRLKNARFVAEASEEVASNAVVKQIAAEREATENARHVRRLVVHLDAIRRRDARLRLQSSLGERRSSLNGVETHIRDLSSDPEIALPVGVTKRRLLVQAEARLVRLRRDDAAAAAMLAHLDRAEAMDEALRDAAARGDAVAVRAWCGRGARPEAPDADGASALDLACGTGHAAVVQVCLDFGADAGGARRRPQPYPRPNVPQATRSASARSPSSHRPTRRQSPRRGWPSPWPAPWRGR